MTKKKILIVEDELIIAQFIQKILVKNRYEVIAIVSSGEEAIRTVERNIPDLVLMDIMLAGKMSGVEAAVQLKNNFGVPIIFLTAYADEKTLEGAISADPYGYLVKPVRNKDICAAVKMAFHMIQREKG